MATKKDDTDKTKSKGGGSKPKATTPGKKDGQKNAPPKRTEPKAVTPGDLPPEVVKAMQSVIDYSWADETASAEESYRENGNIEGHVFADLVTMKNFLDGTNTDPLDHLDVDEDGDGDDEDDEDDED